MTPAEFRDDVRRSVDTLQQITGTPVVGYRAPTFSIMRRNAWAIDVLAEIGLLYDSSIYPVRHDRYGVFDAPRAPFRAHGHDREIVEIPPLTLRLAGRVNLPVGGGGYFRLLPRSLMEAAIRQVPRECRPAVAMLYFHPWEFDPDQLHLPLRWPDRLRTYMGIRGNRERLAALLGAHHFAKAADVAGRIRRDHRDLPRFDLVDAGKRTDGSR